MIDVLENNIKTMELHFYFTYYLLFFNHFFPSYPPCTLGSISPAHRQGWHMAEEHNLQLDSEQCHHCHKCTAHILTAKEKKSENQQELFLICPELNWNVFIIIIKIIIITLPAMSNRA